MVKTGSVISSLVIGQTSEEAMPSSASACSAERSSCALLGLRTSSGVAAYSSASSSLDGFVRANDRVLAIGVRIAIGDCANSTGIGGGLGGRTGLLSESTISVVPPSAPFKVPRSRPPGAASSACASGFSFNFDLNRLWPNGAIALFSLQSRRLPTLLSNN